MTSNERPLRTEFLGFIDKLLWTFAKTYAETWPYESLFRQQVGKVGLLLQQRGDCPEEMLQQTITTTPYKAPQKQRNEGL